MKLRYIVILLLIFASFITAMAQSEDAQIQEIQSRISSDTAYVYFDLFGMKAGTTIYLYAESDEIDTELILCDIDCEKSFAGNDDIDYGAGITASALEYTFESDGDYSIAVGDCCDENAEGSLRLLVGLSAPEVLTGLADPTGDTIAVPYATTNTEQSTTTQNSSIPSQPSEIPSETSDEVQVQEFYSLVSPKYEFIYFDLFGMKADTTIYLYAESDEIDTWIGICDIDCEEKFAENDDISSWNHNSSLEYTFAADGDYSIFISDCCESDITGAFRLLIGFNAPNVLNGTADPTDHTIAVPWGATYFNPDNIGEISGDPQVQGFNGTIEAENPLVYYDIFDAEAGETLSVYLASDDFDTYVALCDITCDEIFAENDDIDYRGGNYNSALIYTFKTGGDYTVVVTAYDEEQADGDFYLLLGYNEPQILTGEAVPNSKSIAVEYEE